jgi:two-component system response regulator (stage 0 sporulation protein F)
MPAQPAQPPNARILVADDDEDARALLATALRADGFEVREADDGSQLLDQLDEAELPELVIADVRMPRMSGLGVLHALRRAQIGTPVILVTALADRSIHTVGKRLGAVAIFRKPIDLDGLRRTVVEALLREARRCPS